MISFLALILLLTSVDAFKVLPTKHFAVKSTLAKLPTQTTAPIRSLTTFALQSSISDETYTEWLDDMIYSGDIEGYIRRRSKDLITDDFLDFLKFKLDECADDDEKTVIQEVFSLIDVKLQQTEGLIDSGVVFEKRLDKVLFKAPNQRRAFIKENFDDMSDAFVEFIQNELKTTTDIDSKVVLASILQLIGQEKQVDLLGNNAVILQRADGTLGEQFEKKESELLQGGSVRENLGKMSIGDQNEQARQ